MVNKSYTYEELTYATRGSLTAPVVVIAESWGTSEYDAKKPLVGASGRELNRMLSEAGIAPNPEDKVGQSGNFLIPYTDILFTNVVNEQPPGNDMMQFFDLSKTAQGRNVRGLYPRDNVLEGLDRLYAQINAHPRKLIIVLGNYALWALGNYHNVGNTKGRKVPTGIMSWRGSQLYTDVPEVSKTPLLPLIHPASILRQWENRMTTVNDMVMRIPLALKKDKMWEDPIPRTYVTAPTTIQAVTELERLISIAEKRTLKLAVDIETVKGKINCLGIAASREWALCIPFLEMTDDPLYLKSYWTRDEFLQVMKSLRNLLTHRNVRVAGHNFLYDRAYIQKWLIAKPKMWIDTMVGQRLCWPTIGKALDMAASMYCEYHQYWKDDRKEWHRNDDLHKLWTYNCIDCVRTFEVAEELEQVVEHFGMGSQLEEQMGLFNLSAEMTTRGVRVNTTEKLALRLELADAMNRTAAFLECCLPLSLRPPVGKNASPWYTSSTQLATIFYDYLKVPVQHDRKTGSRTCKEEALNTISELRPILKPICTALKNYRSAGVFLNNFLAAGIDRDHRMRASFNFLPYTFRWSSSENPFGGGTNMQNIPEGDEDE